MGSLINALPGAVSQGLVWGIMALGVYVTYRILDVADLTVDGSLATGGAVCVILIRAGVNPWVGRPCRRRCSRTCYSPPSYKVWNSCHFGRNSYATCPVLCELKSNGR